MPDMGQMRVNEVKGLEFVWGFKGLVFCQGFRVKDCKALSALRAPGIRCLVSLTLS
jgi:hypothetical protein